MTPVSALCYLALRRDPATLVISTHLVSFVLLALASFLAWNNTGGLGAPASFILPIVPLLVAFLTGPKHALFCGPPWVSLAVHSQVPSIALGPQALLAAQVASPLLTVLTVLGLALSYERNTAFQQEALRRATEQALEASRAKSAFLASMSHLIRTPLGGILGLAELLSATPLSKEQAGMVELLDGSGSSLLTLLNDVLGFSRVEAGALELERHPVDLSQPATEVTGLLERQAVNKGIELSARQQGPAWVLGDPLRLRQILINLGSNALKFTQEGKVEISTQEGPAGTLQVELRVRDSGPGNPGPIVALTANLTPQDRLACQEAGMDGFLPKPLPLNLLAVELSKL